LRGTVECISPVGCAMPQDIPRRHRLSSACDEWRRQVRRPVRATVPACAGRPSAGAGPVPHVHGSCARRQRFARSARCVVSAGPKSGLTDDVRLPWRFTLARAHFSQRNDRCGAAEQVPVPAAKAPTPAQSNGVDPPDATGASSVTVAVGCGAANLVTVGLAQGHAPLPSRPGEAPVGCGADGPSPGWKRPISRNPTSRESR
jgi:hypothetical protein